MCVKYRQQKLSCPFKNGWGTWQYEVERADLPITLNWMESDN
jgi:hypothetical protein